MGGVRKDIDSFSLRCLCSYPSMQKRYTCQSAQMTVVMSNQGISQASWEDMGVRTRDCQRSLLLLTVEDCSTAPELQRRDL